MRIRMPRISGTPRKTPGRSVLLRLMYLILVSMTAVTGCSKTDTNSLHLKSPQTGEKEFIVKSCYAFPVTKSFTDMSGKITTGVSYNVHCANYDLDGSNFGLGLNKPMTSDDHVRVMFSLVGDEGTKEDSALKAGTYAAKADKYMKVETVGIVTRKGGTEAKNWFDRSSLNGEVKISSVSDESASGEIDVTSGDSTIKGSFTMKLLKRK